MTAGDLVDGTKGTDCVDALDRPANSCLIHPRPQPGGQWRLADDNYRTCASCLDNVRDTLREIGVRYLELDATPGASGDEGSRGAPGFGSRPPASPHIIVMMDRRSKPCEVSYDGVLYVFDPNAEDGAGAFVDRRGVWFGSDGRAHSEQPNPVRSVPGTLASLALLVAEERGMRPPPARSVQAFVRWLDHQLDWVTRHELVVEFAHDLRVLLAQLRPVTGDPSIRIGVCPNTLDLGETSTECGTPLFAPTRGDTIRCCSCGRSWPRPEWEALGNLLQEKRLAPAVEVAA